MSKSRILVWLIIAALMGCLTGALLVRGLYAIKMRNPNALAIGADARSPEVQIPFQKPIELDGLSKDEVLALRHAAVIAYPDLVAVSYKPSETVFGQIVDGAPWWGLKGYSFYGAGQQSIEGMSEESRFLINPYLLVAADFYGLGVYSTTNFNWDKSRVTDADVDRADFPLDCYPYGLYWWPAESHAEVHYNLSRCIDRVRPFALPPTDEPLIQFDLISYNARDLNLNYIYVSYSQSSNISHWNQPTDAYEIPHYLHLGGSCGYPGGCNNMSPASPPIDGILIDARPAKAVVWLWENKPPALEHPDMTFVIYFD